MKRINKVVGIGLGRPGSGSLHSIEDSEEYTDSGETSYLQHHTLLHIAEEISRVQDNPDIEVQVQDPQYDDTTKAVLDSNFPKFQVVQDPEAFYVMDNHTLVLLFCMPFDVAEVALSIAGQNGHAGMMCVSDKAHHQAILVGKRANLHTQYQQLHMLKSTKKWEWKEGCKMQEISDEDGWYGGEGVAQFYAQLEGRD
ncbi:hypothetical protein CC86DRAFT_407045 [Ophiobolus disseminans]|uniref:SRR1-like domain-containing protein n=1 Tax=Ophiobolus disseminans TaxID=1469910 RepID=A0A6A6ZY51_9PLEO|nr:hypothetical protein CC86DRAFT_407045 [Ophiobolus disseminans]